MRSIVITGAASGIGRASAERLHRAGWFVGLFDRDQQALKAFQQQLPERSHAEAFDVTDAGAFGAALERFVASAGQLNAIVNCAGVLAVGDFESIPLERQQQMLAINTQGVLNGCYQAFPYLRQQSGARVINLSSASAVYGVPGFATYSASKFFVRGLSEALHIEWRRHDIHVCDIMPPFVKTPMLDNAPPLPIIDRMGVSLNAEDIARAIEQALENKRIHHPLTLKFRLLRNLSRLFPSVVQTRIYGLLAGY
ncbi:SDR family oxidoreductase [Aestuariirhabdus sp. Z084]|uniref:SDR family oxidoreductase n=1 Tax=Aestuariirhabdus haliotis TaxID=2918751 RepID=UPI00201B38B8|nr:SDR family oxidoreductase [Aestuariirhabdus haliotis]MCL6416425.1 SDR family oxidoreductase [Aestuariirhabdus haliotis]MCL6420409.1 SDR family oxidoreductase [Aestuariirhabdus haliotis]